MNTILPPSRERMSRSGMVLLGLVFFIFLAICYVLYRAFVPTTVLTINTHPLPVVVQWKTLSGTSRVVAYRMDYCKDVDFPSTAVRELLSVDGDTIVTLPTAGYSLPRGCYTRTIVESMPLYIPPGRYFLRITFTFRINAVTSPYTFQTEPFDLD
jgi:hypothetical protein